MAKVDLKMPDEFLEQLSKLGAHTDEIAERVLEAGGEVVLAKIRTNLSAVVGKDTKTASRSTGELVGFAFLQAGLPNVLIVVVLEQTECSNRRIVEKPYSLMAVRCAEAVEEIDDLISGDLGVRSSGQANIRTLGCVENTVRLTNTVTVDECILFGFSHTAYKLITEVCFKVESGVVEKLIGDLDKSGELVSANGLLTEGCGGFGNVIALVYPGSGSVRSDNRDLVRTGSGAEGVCQLAELKSVML